MVEVKWAQCRRRIIFIIFITSFKSLSIHLPDALSMFCSSNDLLLLSFAVES